MRSVAVTAPIEALAADERHRLGVLFLLEPDADIALLADDIDRRAHRDERRRLAGLLSHGVDTLARVLEHCLREGRTDADAREFTAWLAEYLERRITVSAWLLDHWDAAPPLAHDSVVDAQQAQATLSRFGRIFEHVRSDRELRGRLHLNNGTLSAPAPGKRVLDIEIDWPPSFQLTCPVRGGFGWFLGEVLTNAVRHGAPGTVPHVSIVCDRIRKELVFQVQNETPQTSQESIDVEGDAYGGLSLLRALARLFDWRDLTFTRGPGRFVACWRVPFSERPRSGQPD